MVSEPVEPSLEADAGRRHGGKQNLRFTRFHMEIDHGDVVCLRHRSSGGFWIIRKAGCVMHAMLVASSEHDSNAWQHSMSALRSTARHGSKA